MTRALRALPAAAVVAVSIGFGTATPAAADAAGDCLANGNVWVIVQSPNGTRAGCATSFGDGEAALRSAGHSLTHNSTGLICRINGYPADCPESPMPFWTYFHAPAGGSWTFSNHGAAFRTPGAGTVEGWRYGDGGPPSSAPPAKTTPQPTTTAPKPTTTAPKPTTTAPKPATTAPRPASTAPQSGERAPTPATTAPRPATSAPQSGTTNPTAPRESTTRSRPDDPTTSDEPTAPGTTTPSGDPTATSPLSDGTGAADPSGTPGAAAGGEQPVATVVDDAGSPSGLWITAGLVGLGAAGTAGAVLFWRRGGMG